MANRRKVLADVDSKNRFRREARLAGHDFLKAWRNPKHREHKAMRAWAPRGFDPEAFDRDKIQKAIKAALRKSKGGYRFRLEQD